MGELSLERGIQKLVTRAKMAKIVTYLVITANVVEIFINFYFIFNNVAGINQHIDSIDNYKQVVFLISTVFVGLWIHRAHANLFALNPSELEYTAAWSVGWFFIPFASLYKPFRAMRELWNISLGDAQRDNTPHTLKSWWGWFLVATLIGNLIARVDAAQQDVTGSRMLLLALSIAAGAMIASAWYLLVTIDLVTSAPKNYLGTAEIFS